MNGSVTIRTKNRKVTLNIIKIKSKRIIALLIYRQQGKHERLMLPSKCPSNHIIWKQEDIMELSVIHGKVD